MKLNLTKEDLDVKFKPAFDMVLVRIPKGPEKTEGGVYLPDVVRDANANESLIAEVVAIGERVVLTIDPALAVGDKVVFTKFTGNHVYSSKDYEYRIVRDCNLQGVLRDGS